MWLLKFALAVVSCLWNIVQFQFRAFMMQAPDFHGDPDEPQGKSSPWSGLRILRGICSVFAAVRSGRAATVAPSRTIASGEMSAETKSDSPKTGFSSSVKILQAATRIASRTVQEHKLSLKVICGAGYVYLYHCGGNVLRESAPEQDDKIARWEYFLGHLACAPCEDMQGTRQTMAQIASIENCATAG